MIVLLAVPTLLLVAALSFTRHHRAVALLTAIIPAYLIRFSIAGVPTNMFEAAVMAALLGGAMRQQVRSQWRHAWRRLPRSVLVAIFLFVLAAVLSVYVSLHLLTSLGIFKGWIVIPIIFGWLVFAAGDGTKTRHQIVGALAAAATVMSLIGLSQIGTLPRVRGLYDVPNSLALFVTPVAVIGWWQGKILVTSLLTAVIITTQSLSAIAALMTTVLLGTLQWPRRGSKKMVSALLIVGALTLTYFTITGRLAYLANFLAGHSNSVSVRLQLWSISRDLIYENPLLGVGLGTFEPAYQQKLHERFAEPARYQPVPEFVFRDPHNWLLSFWLNMGLLGLISFVAMHVLILGLPLRHHMLASRQTQALTLSILSLLIFGLTDTIYWKNDLAALHWLFLALLLNETRVDSGKNNIGQ